MNKNILKNIPNFLTTFRIVIIPILIMSFYIEGMVAHFIAAALFAIAAITDYFDGYFARALKVQSNFGRCLDPIADKLLVIVAIVMLINFSERSLWILIPGLIIICREVLVSGLREFLAELRVSVPVSKLAKYKTAVQMVAITGLLLGIKLSLVLLMVFLAKALFCLAAILTVITGYAYFRVGMKNM